MSESQVDKLNSNLQSGFVSLMTRILSDPVIREEFERDPHSLFNQYGLTDSESKALLAIDHRQLQMQAQTLIDKRWHEILKLIPQTTAEARPEIRDLFQYFATQFWPSGFQRHLMDAFEFIRFLERNQVGSIDKQEKARLQRILGRVSQP